MGEVDGCAPWPGSGRATCKKESAAMLGRRLLFLVDEEAGEGVSSTAELRYGV
jgi:hypothetical protein